MCHALVLLCLSVMASGSSSNLLGQESVRWVNNSGIKESQLEPVGTWYHGKLYVGRAKVEGAWIPGMVFFREGTFNINVAWSGKEILQDGQVLISTPGSTAWVQGQPGTVQSSAIVGGFDPRTDEATFICRANVVSNGKSYLMIGKYLATRNGCEIPDLVEAPIPDFELVVALP